MSHHQKHPAFCHVCGKQESDEEKHTGGFCPGCLLKVGIVVLIIMVIVSYVAWFGLI
jgi:NMD protein affecting ribosome stability and mRNA decay